MNFKDLNIDDKESLDKFFYSYGKPHCDFSFAANFCSNHIYHYKWCISDNFLCLKYINDDKKVEYAFPIGMGNPLPLVELLEKDAQNDFILSGIDEEAVDTMRSHYPTWGFASDRRFADYIYLASDLRELKGRKYEKKRNHIKKFESLYNYKCLDLTEDLFPDCINLESKWLSEKYISGEGIPMDTLEEELTDEQKVIRNAFRNFKVLGLTGCALYVEDKIAAFTFGSAINKDTFCTHIEKADISFEGCYSMINHLMALRISDKFKYIDREWDGGIDGLRRAKLSYHPAFLSKKIIGRQLSKEELEIRDLWLESFPEDSVSDADEFILTKFNPKNMLCHKENDKIVSMLHIIPFDKTAYLFAISTLKEHRSKGYASKLIKEAIQKCKKDGFERIALIPSEDSLKDWYNEFGFSGSLKMDFDNTDDFCYGTGDPDKDIAMIINL